MQVFRPFGKRAAVVLASLALLLSSQLLAIPATQAAPVASESSGMSLIYSFGRAGFSADAGTLASVDASAAKGSQVVSTALRYVGTRYRYGGASPAGFDCSGFVYYVMNKSGVPVGRVIPSQVNSGPRVSSSNLRPGDLVFFSNTYKRGLSHAGIYIGNGKFVNAANENTGVVVSNLWSSYWKAHYATAVRPY